MLGVVALLVQVQQGPTCAPPADVARIIADNQLRATTVFEDAAQNRWTVIERPNDGSALFGFYLKSTGAFCIVTQRGPRKGA